MKIIQLIGIRDKENKVIIWFDDKRVALDKAIELGLIKPYFLIK